MGEQKQVHRRKVFYIPGFDPFPPRRYRELYRTESKLQAQISGYDITQDPLTIENGFGWRVHGKMDGASVETEIEVLVWADLVKTSMSDGIWATYAQMMRTAWIYISTGTLRDIMKLRKGPVIAALYPIGFLIGQLVLAMLGAWVLWIGLAMVSVWLAPLAILVIWPILAFFRKLDGKVFAYYLMHDYAHTAQKYGAYPDNMLTRLAVFGEKIAAAQTQDLDEVLVVGHSSGAHLAVSVLAALDRAGRLSPISFLSLGQVVPMVSFLPKAHKLRRDLRDLSLSEQVTWVDVTAPGDGCTFALCDPVAVTGVATGAQKWPLVISAAFTQTLKPETWARLRWRFFRLHFQYLCAFDNVGDYDYFRITAGPMTLADRFLHRDPSKSRILTPTARYRGMDQ